MRRALTSEVTFSFIASDRKSEIMKRRFILYRRKLGGTFYVEDTETNRERARMVLDTLRAAGWVQFVEALRALLFFLAPGRTGPPSLRTGFAKADCAPTNYRPGASPALNQIAFGASERAATMSGQPSPLKSAKANPYTVPLPSFQGTS